MLIKQGDRLINARNWSELVKPEKILHEDDVDDNLHAKFICEPLERGYGTTIGNAMRGCFVLPAGSSICSRKNFWCSA